MTNYTEPPDNLPFAAQLGVQFDRADPSPRPAGPARRPRTRPAKEMHLRVLDGNPAVDKYGLNAYIYDSKNDRKTRYDRVLFSRAKAAADKVAEPQRGEWADVKVKINGSLSSNGKTAAYADQGRAPVAPNLSDVRLIHTRVTRAIANGRTGRREPDITGDFED